MCAFLRNGICRLLILIHTSLLFLFFLVFVSFVMAVTDIGLLRAVSGLLVSGIIILSCKQKCKRMCRESLLELSLVYPHIKENTKIIGIYPNILNLYPPLETQFCEFGFSDKSALCLNDAHNSFKSISFQPAWTKCSVKCVSQQ